MSENDHNPTLQKIIGLLPSKLSPRARLVICISLMGNISLFVIKVVLGHSIGSLSVVADGFHSLSDCLATMMVFLGLWAATKKADKHHPFGHGRSEYIGTMVLGVLLIVAAFELAREAVMNLFSSDDVDIDVTPWAIIIVLGAALVKTWMYKYIADLGRLEKSELIYADALHHRVDAITSIAVGAGLLGVAAGYPALDAILTLVVAGLVAHTGYEMGRGAASILMGREITPEMKEWIKERVMTVDGVHNPHDIVIHDYGATKSISIHVDIDPKLNLEQAHEITDKVVECLRNSFKGQILVHADPMDVE